MFDMTESMLRRNFLLTLAAPAWAQSQPMTIRDFLEKMAYTREDVSIFLDPAQKNWAKFDPGTGLPVAGRRAARRRGRIADRPELRKSGRANHGQLCRPSLPHEYVRRQLHARPSGQRWRNLAGVPGGPFRRTCAQLRNRRLRSLPGLSPHGARRGDGLGRGIPGSQHLRSRRPPAQHRLLEVAAFRRGVARPPRASPHVPRQPLVPRSTRSADRQAD